jgi:hypothetical protein
MCTVPDRLTPVTPTLWMCRGVAGVSPSYAPPTDGSQGEHLAEAADENAQRHWMSSLSRYDETMGLP